MNILLSGSLIQSVDIDGLGDLDVEAASLVEGLRDLFALLLGEIVSLEDGLDGVVQLGTWSAASSMALVLLQL